MKYGKLLISLSVLSFALACSQIPQTHYYLFDYSIEDKDTFSNALKETVLGFAQVEVNVPYNQDRLIYRRSRNEIEFYHYHRWISPPAELIWQQLFLDLSNSNLFNKVVDYTAYSEKVDYVLQMRLIRLEEWDEGKDWFAVMELNVRLKEAKTGREVFNKLLSVKKPIAERTPYEVVKALNTVLKECSEQLLKMLEGLT
jgi:ABC-type uncharacterized transport system auxiliary subunit